jgi:undecaprenyl-diphosphatase
VLVGRTGRRGARRRFLVDRSTVLAVSEPPTVEHVIAERLEQRIPAERRASIAPRVIRDVDVVDRAVYLTVARTSTPTLDRAMRRLSRVADYSRLWAGIAFAIAFAGGRRGRRSAVTGMAAVGLTSATVNLLGKHLFRRDRPDRANAATPHEREVPMPTSTSFPSGHSASAFAFANAVSSDWPALAFPLRLLAGSVAYSRVHTGVHYPGDVVFGSLVGAAVGDIVAVVARRRRR